MTAAGDLGHAGYPMLGLTEVWAPIRIADLAEGTGLDTSTRSRRVPTSRRRAW